MTEAPTSFPADRSPETPRGRWLWACLLLLALGKLVLVSHDEVLSFGADDTGYAVIAQHWYWGNPYGLYAYTRQPTFPLTVAISGAIGIPWRVSIELLWIGASLVAAGTLRACGVRPWLVLVGAAMLLFDPLTLTLFNRLLPDGLYAAAILLMVSGACAAIADPRPGRLWCWSAAAALGAAVAATSRPESPYVWAVLGAIAAAAVLTPWPFGTRSPGAALYWRIIAAAAVPAIAALALTHAYSYANLKRIGVYATSDFLTPGFRRLYHDLVAVPPEHPSLLLSVPHDVREKAYAASPTFARLRPFLDGEQAVPDGRLDCRVQTGVDGEYGAWTCWALRAAAWRAAEADPAGALSSAGQMDGFFAKAADELERAQVFGTLPPSRWAPLDFVPPEWGQLGTAFPAAAWRNCVRLVHRDYMQTPPETLPAPVEHTFDDVALRRAALVRLSRAESEDHAGWLSAGVVQRLNFAKCIIAQTQNILAPAAVLAGVGGVVVGFIRWRTRDPRLRTLTCLLLVLGAAIGLRLGFVALLDATGVLFVRVVDAADNSAAAPAIGGPPVQLRYLFPISALLGPMLVVATEVLWAGLRRRSAAQS